MGMPCFEFSKSHFPKMSFLFSSKCFYAPDDFLTKYRSQIGPTLQYCSHVRGAAPTFSLELLDSIQKREIRKTDTNHQSPLNGTASKTDF